MGKKKRALVEFKICSEFIYDEEQDKYFTSEAFESLLDYAGVFLSGNVELNKPREIEYEDMKYTVILKGKEIKIHKEVI